MKFYQVFEGRNITKDDGYFSASVPGNIQLDYGNHKGFPNPAYSVNSELYLPLEDDFWEYRAKLSFERKDAERVYFVSRGIDYKYDVLLNGEKIYSYEGMFKPFELDITELLRGDDVLKIIIYPHPKREGAPERTRTEADASCKPPVSYGWDWNPRLLISGLWQEAYVETRDGYYIDKTEVRAFLDESMKQGRVRFDFDCGVPCVCALYDRDGNEIYRGSEREFVLESPRLWWCNGQGEPYLYRWSIDNGREKREGRLGFRRVRLVRNANADAPASFPKTRYFPPITVELNGRKIFAKGSNWVNPDIFWGRIDRKTYDDLLVLARDANMNMLRLWGGASVNKESFYELCDEYGIMVWQEFMLACNNYLPRGNYLDVLRSEATSIIKQLRHHPSIALWCGGNELFNAWSGMDDQSLPLRLINSLCLENDPETPFIMTSPLMGMGHGGYMFDSAAQRGEVFNEFITADNTAYTEFGVPSVSSVESLKKIIPEDELFPICETPSWRIHHGFRAWGRRCWLCLDVFEKYWGEPQSLEELCEGSAYMQCAGYQAAFEEGRRQWPHASMTLNWCFNEPWNTAANNSLIEYPAKPKPSYEAVKNSLRPTLFSARIPKFKWSSGETFEAELWLLNDTQEAVTDSVRVTLTVGDTVIDVIEWNATAEINSNKRGPTVRVELPEESGRTLSLRLENGNGRDSTYRLMYEKKEKKTVDKNKPRTMNT